MLRAHIDIDSSCDCHELLLQSPEHSHAHIRTNMQARTLFPVCVCICLVRHALTVVRASITTNALQVELLLGAQQRTVLNLSYHDWKSILL